MLICSFSSSSLPSFLRSFLYIHTHTYLYEDNTGEKKHQPGKTSSTVPLKQWTKTEPLDLLLKYGIKITQVTKNRIYSGSRSNENK